MRIVPNGGERRIARRLPPVPAPAGVDRAAQDRERLALPAEKRGGLQPLWGPPGSGELYYRSFDGAVIAVEVRTAPDLEIGARRELFPNRGYGSIATAGAWFYAVSPIDGRFLVTKDITLPRPAPIRVVVDWLEELNALVPVQ